MSNYQKYTARKIFDPEQRMRSVEILEICRKDMIRDLTMAATADSSLINVTLIFDSYYQFTNRYGAMVKKDSTKLVNGFPTSIEWGNYKYRNLDMQVSIDVVCLTK